MCSCSSVYYTACLHSCISFNSMASTIIQVYLKQLLESFFHPQSRVRLAALNVIILVLRQGLVHPVQVCVFDQDSFISLYLYAFFVDMPKAYRYNSLLMNSCTFKQLRQNLVIFQIVPYLICMGSDCDRNIRPKADQQLQEIDKKYPGFIQVTE